jgi:hypothetical protein
VITRSVLDTRYVAIPISATGPTGAAINPTGDTVQMAFMPQGVNPGSGDWHTGSWATTSGGGYQAQCLVGPANGGVALTAGVYQIWVKATDNPEVPVIPADLLQIV